MSVGNSLEENSTATGTIIMRGKNVGINFMETLDFNDEMICSRKGYG